MEQKSEETNPSNSGGNGDSNFALWDGLNEKGDLQDYETWFGKYQNDVKKGPKGEVLS